MQSTKKAKYRVHLHLNFHTKCGLPWHKSTWTSFAVEVFNTNNMDNTTADHPYIHVKALRPSMVRIQHTYAHPQSYQLNVTAYSIYDVMNKVTASVNVNVTENINVTVINVQDYIKTGENVTLTLEPHTGKSVILLYSL